jgi:hypothetical protein
VKEYIYQANGPRKQAIIAIAMSSKVNFKPKLEETKKETSY